VRILTGHRNPIGRLQFSPDGRWLLSDERPSAGSHNPDRARVTDLVTGRGVALPDAFHATFTPDGAHVLFFAGRGRERPLLLFDPRSGTTAPLTIPGRSGHDYMWPVFTPDGTRCASFNISALLECVLCWTTYPGWEPAGQWRFDLREPGVCAPCQGVTPAFSPDGRLFAVVSRGIVLYDVATGRPAHVQETGVEVKNAAGFLRYSPCGRRLAFGSGGKVVVFDTQTWAVAGELKLNRKTFNDAAFTPDGRRLLTAGTEETVKVWDTTTWSVVNEYAWQAGSLSAVAVAPDGMTAAAGGGKRKVVLWDLDD
jgi:WD40 repeat protein